MTYQDIFITCGLASAIDAVAWAICNDGNGILIPRLLFNGFTVDLMNRSNVQVIGANYREIEKYSGIDSLFEPGINHKAMEAALRRARQDGITVRALLVSK